MARVDPDLVIIVAAHNRRALTLRALDGALASSATAGLNAVAVLFDDGSTDGTADAVRVKFGDRVSVIEGDGSAFWARSMSLAEDEALRMTDRADALLMWLNDDVELDPDAVSLLAGTCKLGERIAVGTMRDPQSGTPTYGGLVRSGLHPLRLRLASSASDSQTHVQTFNGNVVMLSFSTAKKIGGIDGGFAHALADIDYGFRAEALGVPVVTVPGTVGTCALNPPTGHESLRAAWARFRSRKGGGHPQSMERILRRVRPGTWRLWWIYSYAAWFLRQVSSRGARAIAGASAPRGDR